VTRFFGRALARRLAVMVLTGVIAAGCAEAMFRWYVRVTFDAEFPPWTENLVADQPGSRMD
jgi:hypothetical protein